MCGSLRLASPPHLGPRSGCCQPCLCPCPQEAAAALPFQELLSCDAEPLLAQVKSLQEDRKEQLSLLGKREGCIFLEVYSWYLLERLHKQQRPCVPTGEDGWGRAPAPGRRFPSGHGEQAAKRSRYVFMDPLRRRLLLGSGTLVRDVSVWEGLPLCAAAQSGQLGCHVPETAPASASQSGEAAPGWVAPFFIWSRVSG